MRLLNSIWSNANKYANGVVKDVLSWAILGALAWIGVSIMAMNTGSENGSIARKQNELEHPQLKAITDTLKMNDVKTRHCIELIQKDIEEINARDEREYQMLRDLYQK